MKKQVLKERNRESHKGDYGKLLVVAGSYGMAGAAVMCGSAAIRSGVGIVRFLVPERLFTILQISVPEATCIERESFRNIDFNQYEAIAVGPGLGTDDSNEELLKNLLSSYTGKLVIDADGLNSIVKFELGDLVANSKADIIITPHIGEASRLLGNKSYDSSLRMEWASELAEKYKCTVLLKGADTVVFSKKEYGGSSDGIYVNTTGNPGMATGGSGDVLTGIIGSLAAQGYDSFESTKIGAYVHGLAGDICAEEKGQIGMTAMDIVLKVPEAFKIISQLNS